MDEFKPTEKTSIVKEGETKFVLTVIEGGCTVVNTLTKFQVERLLTQAEEALGRKKKVDTTATQDIPAATKVVLSYPIRDEKQS